MARRVVDVLRTPFGFLFARTRKEELISEYVIREHHLGRSLTEILDDNYVTNHCSADQIRRLLDRPEIIHAVGDDVIAAHRSAPPA